MIETLVDQDYFNRLRNDTLHNIVLIQRMKEAGVPVIGNIQFRGVERGTMIWRHLVDLDEDTMVIRWFDEGEDVNDPSRTLLRTEQQVGCVINVFGNEDEEL